MREQKRLVITEAVESLFHRARRVSAQKSASTEPSWHLLAAMLESESDTAGKLLRYLVPDADGFFQKLLSHDHEWQVDQWMRPEVALFFGKVLNRAIVLAVIVRQWHVGTEHVLMALSESCPFLTNLGIRVFDVAHALDKLSRDGVIVDSHAQIPPDDDACPCVLYYERTIWGGWRLVRQHWRRGN
jgi:hypothetical protein